MKVVLVNGSPNRNGCTNRALEEIALALEAEGVESEIYWIGRKPQGGCMGCNACARKGGCVVDDRVNELRAKAAEADGFIFGGPVHYAHMASSLLGFMDRFFYLNESAGESAGDILAHKPAAVIATARRAGITPALDEVQRFFTDSQMPIVSSHYWNGVHGPTVCELEQDEEGLSVMRQLGHNMAWLLKCIEAGRIAGVKPVDEPHLWTNFIR